MVYGLGFRVQGLGFRVSGLGFRVSGLGFRCKIDNLVGARAAFGFLHREETLNPKP
jgi:hypothetical protein